MTKHLLAGVAAAVLISGVASAQLYPPAPPPPPGAVVVPAPPPPPFPGTSTITTTVSPSPDDDHSETTIHRRLTRKAIPSSRRMFIAKGSQAAPILTRRQRLTATAGAPQLLRPPRNRDSGGLGLEGFSWPLGEDLRRVLHPPKWWITLWVNCCLIAEV